MATTATQRQGWLARLLSNPVLAVASAILFACAVVAVAKGRADWARVPGLVWVHLGSILLATGLTPVMLLRRKGDGRHRKLGYVWVGAMLLTAISSLFFSTRVPGGLGVFTGDFSFIHILSVLVLLQVPRIVVKARRHTATAMKAPCAPSSSARCSSPASSPFRSIACWGRGCSAEPGGDCGDFGFALGEAPGHHRPNLCQDFGACGHRRAASDRLRIIFDRQLHRLGNVAAMELFDDAKGEINARGDTAGGDTVAIDDDAFLNEFGAK